MGAFLDRHRDRIYALMRIVAGYMFACHGAMKVFGPAGSMSPALQWTAGLIELVGGTLICVGLFTRWAAFVSSGTMAVAYFVMHQPTGLLPIQNHGELAALYSWVFLFIAARGSGPWSVEGDRQGRT